MELLEKYHTRILKKLRGPIVAINAQAAADDMAPNWRLEERRTDTITPALAYFEYVPPPDTDHGLDDYKRIGVLMIRSDLPEDERTPALHGDMLGDRLNVPSQERLDAARAALDAGAVPHAIQICTVFGLLNKRRAKMRQIGLYGDYIGPDGRALGLGVELPPSWFLTSALWPVLHALDLLHDGAANLHDGPPAPRKLTRARQYNPFDYRILEIGPDNVPD